MRRDLNRYKHHAAVSHFPGSPKSRLQFWTSSAAAHDFSVPSLTFLRRRPDSQLNRRPVSVPMTVTAPWRSVRRIGIPRPTYVSSIAGEGCPYAFAWPTEITATWGLTALRKGSYTDPRAPWWGTFRTAASRSCSLPVSHRSASRSMSPVKRNSALPHRRWSTTD